MGGVIHFDYGSLLFPKNMTKLQIGIVIISTAFLLLSVGFSINISPIKKRIIVIFIVFVILIILNFLYFHFEKREQKREKQDIQKGVAQEFKKAQEEIFQKLPQLLSPIIEQKIRESLFSSKLGQAPGKSQVSFEELLSSATPEERAYIHKMLGVEYYRKNNFQDAEIEFKMAIENNPTDIDSHRFLGIIFGQQRRLSEAKSTYLRIINLKSDVSTLEEQLQLAVLYEYLGRGTSALQSALQLYNNIVKLNGAYVELAKDRIEYITNQLRVPSSVSWTSSIPPIAVISYPSSGAEFNKNEGIIFKGTVASPRSVLDYYTVEHKNISKQDSSWSTIIKVDYYETEEIVGGTICKWVPWVSGKYVVRVFAKDISGYSSSHQIILTIKEK